MQLVVLYGAPGVGKLTVAQALADPTGYKVLHNHLTVDLVTAIFAFGSEQAFRLSSEFRLTMLREAAMAQIPGLIFTFVYAAGEDDDLMQEIHQAVEPLGGGVKLVLLTCDRDILRQRVVDKSRARFTKIRSVELLDELMAQRELSTPYPHAPSLVLDTTDLSPDLTAARILDYLKETLGE